MVYRIVAGLLAIGIGWMVIVSLQEGTLPLRKAIIYILVGAAFLLYALGGQKLLERFLPVFKKKEPPVDEKEANEEKEKMEEPQRSPPRFRYTVWWKIYFWIAAVLIGLSLLASFFFTVSAYEVIDLAVSVIGVIGLFGLAYSKRMLSVDFWKFFFYIAFLETIIYTFVLPYFNVPLYGEPSSINVYAFIEIAFGIPFLLGLYVYAFRRDVLWEDSEQIIDTGG
ncbi:hypothetical protein ACFL9T_16375 [Thermodesulfobacteriota bacterium]